MIHAPAAKINKKFLRMKETAARNRHIIRSAFATYRLHKDRKHDKMKHSFRQDHVMEGKTMKSHLIKQKLAAVLCALMTVSCAVPAALAEQYDTSAAQSGARCW